MNYKNIHFKSGWHERDILNSKQCGCFHCLTIFKSNKITQWIDEDPQSSRGVGRTALCPECGIDAILPDNIGYEITNDLLMQMNKKYFH